MKKCFQFLLLLISTSLFAVEQPNPVKLKSPDGNLEVSFYLKNGIPYYSLNRKNAVVIKESRLGLILTENQSLDKDFKVADIQESAFNETWKPVLGEVSTIQNHYKSVKISLEETSKLKRRLDVVFKVYNDGLGFRYEFPKQANLQFFVISRELTAFNLTGDHKAFWIPGDYDSNEYHYATSKISEVDAWKQPLISKGKLNKNIPDQYAVQTPLMLKTADGLYINIHEAALVNYPAMQLHVDRSNYSLSANLVPDALGNSAYLRAPGNTPWRTIIVSDKATDILASKMILNLNEPSKLANTSWIKPLKYMGVWWEMQIGKSNWNYTFDVDSLSSTGTLIPQGNHGANTANVKRYIDFASKNGIKGLLVEGWNTGWEEWTGNWKENNFDYVTPYPDFNVEEITEYAKQKGVEMIMHNETGGSATNYDRHLDTAFRFMNKYSYKSVKTGYVGQITPRGEHHDGQWMIEHFVRVAEKAAQYQVMVNMHESVRPTGLNRTYPNWIANEAGRGNEWNAFSDGNTPEHETILPFTRLMGGPMDYTPGIFKLRNYASNAPDRQMHTTLAKQLALYVTMYSPLQMAADLPENYEAHQDAFQFIKDVGVDWDDTKILEAEPGDYITIARKEKGKANWFVGAITDENSRQSVIPLNFLDKGRKYTAIVYKDGKDADWKTNPEAYTIEKRIVTSSTKLKLNLAKGGGAAISLIPVQ
ncbi:glycoside hydrolase family 97 protein [Arcticibacter eurypsychrophilus]|uniref:glycoside hydrolase family 97 protein n=1 Tax=Arcticibacter eurypsychrophilus TaxID=1434752 RepID=UPI00084D585B|nr:glycoside hydrolase family 97 protein [Arcticibacter eurypsychrophilus]